jgi:branched-subunit amino acid aminotransferase/4-amino-4-deoxychorismate lyase
VREGEFTLPALLRADEAFTSSAVREIVPVVSIDGRELSRGDAAPRLQGLLEEIV